MLTTRAIFMAIHRMEGVKVMQYMPGVITIREIPGRFHFRALCVWLCTSVILHTGLQIKTLI